MPYSYQAFNGGAAGISLAVSVPFLLRAHVSLYTDYDQYVGTYNALLVEGTHYNWVSDTLITTLTSTAGRVITVKRKTPTNALLVGWADGSNVDMDDLLTADRQNLYAVQEQEDASSLVTATAGLALSQVAASLPYTAVATVAGITATPNNQLRVEIADSTGIQSFSPLTGRPSGFVGATNLTVRLVYTTIGNTWQWLDYRPTNPDDRYGTIASVTAASTSAAAAQTTANTANTAAAAAQTTANTANTAAAAAQTTANTKAPTASPTFTGTVTIPAGASISGFAPLASPTLTGTPAAPTATAGANTTQLATTAFVTGANGAKADLASPTFTGTPAAPTATAGVNTTQLATTAFVATATAFTQDGTGAVVRTVVSKLKEAISIKDFGAVGNGSTDDRAALVAALAAVKAKGGGTLYLPKGTYLISKGQVFIDCSIDIVGEASSTTVLRYQDESSNTRADFLNTVNPNTVVQTWDISLRNLTIQSGLGAGGGNYTVCSHLASFVTSGNVSFLNCSFSNSRFMATVVAYAKSVTVTNCRYTTIAWDGVHATNCDNISVTGCYFYQIGDDAVAVGRVDTALVENNGNSRQTVISNNIFEDSGGVAALGSKHTVINNNTFTRVMTRAIEVGFDSFAETGNTAAISIVISSNVVDTVFTNYGLTGNANSGDSAKYISILCPNPTALPSGGYVGLANSTGGVNQPFPYFYTNNTDSVPPATGAWFVVVSNNVCTRTLAPTSAWSNYGFGQLFAGHGLGFVDPVVDKTDLTPVGQAGIRIEGSLYHAVLSSNVIQGQYNGIEFTTNATGVVSWDDVLVFNNEISNFEKAGIKYRGSGSIDITSNNIDGDPYHVHTARATGGTWGTGWDSYWGIWSDNTIGDVGVVCQGNTFRNIGYDYQCDATKTFLKDNIYKGYPKGYSALATNIGIRGWNLGTKSWVIIDDNPSSANFKKILNSCYSSWYQLPTTGYYVKDTIVYKESLAVLGTSGSQYIVTGWLRLTDGSGHVLNTDWKEMRVLTGT